MRAGVSVTVLVLSGMLNMQGRVSTFWCIYDRFSTFCLTQYTARRGDRLPEKAPRGWFHPCPVSSAFPREAHLPRTPCLQSSAVRGVVRVRVRRKLGGPKRKESLPSFPQECQPPFVSYKHSLGCPRIDALPVPSAVKARWTTSPCASSRWSPRASSSRSGRGPCAARACR